MRRSLTRFAAAVCVAATAGCARRTPPPASTGVLALDLSAPVRVVRDRWGVPHIYASTERDVFVAQGFIQARDRLFQMDLWRRAVQGRLSEVLGANFAARDAMTRRMHYRGDLAVEWASYGRNVKSIVEAFVTGINAWVEMTRERVPEEFALAGWRPEPWRAEDLLNRTDAFVTGGDALGDVFRARLIAAVGESRANALAPSAARFRTPPGLDVQSIGYVVADALRRVGTPPFFVGLAAPVREDVRDVRFQPDRWGSNVWAVAGRRSTTGAPLLANDQHRPFAHPSLRYLVHLSAPGWNVIGATSPWLPGVAVGHNDRVAWGMAARSEDTQDVYVEHVNPMNAHQVETDGRFVDTTIVKDPIAIRGQAEPLDLEIELTPRGVVVASDREHHLAFAVRWIGMEPGAAAELAASELDRAESAPAFRDALQRWKLPIVDVVYATSDGQIGRQAAGAVPTRRGWDGALPAPGFRSAFEWHESRPLNATDPSASRARSPDVLLSANQDPRRVNRLATILLSATDGRDGRSFSVADFERIQHDTMSWNAQQLVPLLERVHGNDEIQWARSRLIGWDRRMTVDSEAATLYAIWERVLLRRLADDRLPPALIDGYIARARLPVDALVHPSAAWFPSSPIASRDRLLVDALQSAVDELRSVGGPDEAQWRWGRLHTVTFRHPLGVSAAARRRFNVGPFEMAGYSGTVMATDGDGFDVEIGPSFREILDVADWDRSVVTNAPGQAESPASAHFADLAKIWAAGGYVPLVFSDRAVQANAESLVTLIPKARRGR